jgi:hypothetical protein
MRHDNKGYRNFACEAYEVQYDQERADGSTYIEIKMTTKDTEIFEQVGANEPYSVAYISNPMGKTIDRVD